MSGLPGWTNVMLPIAFLDFNDGQITLVAAIVAAVAGVVAAALGLLQYRLHKVEIGKRKAEEAKTEDLRRRPFEPAQFWMFEDEEPLPVVSSIRNGKPLIGGKDAISVAPGKYHVIIQVFPRIPVAVNEVNLRFFENDQSKPKVLEFQDLEPKGSRFTRKRDNSLGFDGWYDPVKHVSKGQAISFTGTFDAPGTWSGELSVYLHSVGNEPCSLRITTVCQQEPAAGKSHAP